MSTNNHETLLARLQQEVNLVLEHTGRLFAAVNTNGKTAPVVQAGKLKQILPGSNYRFHDALDQLEDELHTAKLVMRRDLAMCREQSGLQKPLPTTEPVTTKAMPEKTPETESKSSKAEPGKPPTRTPIEVEDAVMQDSQLADVSMTEDAPHIEGSFNQDDNGRPEPSDEAKELRADSQGPVDASDNTQDSTASALRVDTQSQHQPKEDKVNIEQQNENDRELDTGTFSNTNDLESLFGAPLSAEAGDAPEFDIDTNNDTADFDFEAFGGNGADNDNIAALLPGLQDYANDQATEGGGTDFDALFSTDMTAEPEGQDDGEEPNMQHRDSTFDDLFDLTDFNAGDFSAGGGEGENKDFEFTFD